jgi:hypothetical protein
MDILQRDCFLILYTNGTRTREKREI